MEGCSDINLIGMQGRKMMRKKLLVVAGKDRVILTCSSICGVPRPKKGNMGYSQEILESGVDRRRRMWKEFRIWRCL